MDLYCAAVITQKRVLALAVDEENELPIISEQPQALYARYYGAAHVYRLFSDLRGGQLVLTSRASIEPVGPAMPVRPLVLFSDSQHRSVCQAVEAAQAEESAEGVRPSPPADPTSSQSRWLAQDLAPPESRARWN